MNKKKYLRSVAPWALAVTAILALSACAGATASTTASSAEGSAPAAKEAGPFTKDMNVCFENKSSSAVVLTWMRGVNSTTGSGVLAAGHTFCGEGKAPKATLALSDSFSLITLAENPLIGYPTFTFKGAPETTIEICDQGGCIYEKDSEQYTSAAYSPNESLSHDIEGHKLAVTRNTNNAWVNFTVAILDIKVLRKLP